MPNKLYLNKRVRLSGLNRHGLNKIANYRYAVKRAQGLIGSDGSHMYVYIMPNGNYFMEEIQTAVEGETEVLMCVALLNKNGEWVKESLWNL